jgi:hypothetical protein
MVELKHIQDFDGFLTESDLYTDKPRIFLLHKTGDGQGEVRTEDGGHVADVNSGLIEDGTMSHEDDLTGLRDYLIKKGKMSQNDTLTPAQSVGGANSMVPNRGTDSAFGQLAVPVV